MAVSFIKLTDHGKEQPVFVNLNNATRMEREDGYTNIYFIAEGHLATSVCVKETPEQVFKKIPLTIRFDQ
jgi:hypothetical protein